MDCGDDFIQLLGSDMAIKVLTHLDDAADLARVCAASRSWRRFVIANSISKQLCLRLFPEVLGVARSIEVNNVIEPLSVTRINPSAVDLRNHRVYAFLARALSPAVGRSCISEAISASSTDNYPEESVQNTLEARDRVELRASYWSSKGQIDPKVPETLVYKSISKLCLITEIHVHPFQAYFQFGFPIYSAKAVRFRMGHPRFPMERDGEMADEARAQHGLSDGDFGWTYTSPEFPMAQDNCLQKFKLPEPALCIGGFLQVELLGRVQRQEMDGLYYICVSHVNVIGRPLLPSFDVEVVDPSGKCTLKYYPEAETSMSTPSSAQKEEGGASLLRTFTARLMQRGVRSWEQMILSTILGSAVVVDSDDESDEEDVL